MGQSSLSIFELGLEYDQTLSEIKKKLKVRTIK